MLRCEHISKSFDGVHAAVDLSVRLDMPGIVAIVGPNGAGKTTLINIITGFMRAQSGHVWFDEKETTLLPPYRIAQLGISRSFQDLRLIRRLSVLENVLLAQPSQSGETIMGALFGASVTDRDVVKLEQAMELLRVLGIEESASQFAGEMSYGQQKLLSIACCLATRSRVFLFDEPVAGVHPELVDRILGLLRKLGQNENLVVFIEHNLAAVREIADRVLVMDEGRIIADGRPAEVLQRPQIIEAYVT